MKVTKVIRSDDAVRFFSEVQGHLAIEERDQTCHEAPLDSFDVALQALGPVACNINEYGVDYAKGMTVTALRLSYTKHGTRSAQIVFSKHLDATDADHKGDTPFFQFDDAKGEDSGRRQCTPAQAAKIHKMIEETESYAGGKRQQLLLPIGDRKDKEGKPSEPANGEELKFGNDAGAPPETDGLADKKPTATKKPKKTKKK